MATCPNCGRKLHLYNWKPDCPDCGVNMVYFKSNERLLAETEAAEIAHAKSQPSIDRAKSSFLGSPVAISRSVVSVLPLPALFLPLFKTAEGRVNAIGLYKIIGGLDFGKAFGGDGFALGILLLLVSAVMILVCMGCTVMSLARHGRLRNLILDLFMLLCAVGAAVCIGLSGCTLSAGFFVYIGLILAITVYNQVLGAKGLPVLNKTVCLIGGLPSDEYFAMVEQGVSDLEIRKKMVAALTKMQDEVREKAAEAEQKALEERAHRK